MGELDVQGNAIGADALAMMWHCVGHLKRNGRNGAEPFRNYYCASSEDTPKWELLVSLGLARLRSAPHAADGGAPVYAVSDAGIAFLKALRKEELGRIKRDRAGLK